MQITIDLVVPGDTLSVSLRDTTSRSTRETHMPDFGALSDLFGGIGDILGAVTTFAGSLAGDGGVNEFVDAIESISASGE